MPDLTASRPPLATLRTALLAEMPIPARLATKAYDVLLFNVAHPRWEFVFQPKYGAYLNLIEP